MDEDEDLYAELSCCGWLVVEIIERMIQLDFLPAEICEALDLPSESHMLYMMARGQEERNKLMGELTDGS